MDIKEKETLTLLLSTMIEDYDKIIASTKNIIALSDKLGEALNRARPLIMNELRKPCSGQS